MPTDKVVLRRLRHILVVLAFALTALLVWLLLRQFKIPNIDAIWITCWIFLASLIPAAAVLAANKEAPHDEWQRQMAIRMAQLEDAVRDFQGSVSLDVSRNRMLARIDRIARQVNILSTQVLGHDMDEVLVRPAEPRVDPTPTLIQTTPQEPTTNWLDRLADDEEHNDQ